MGLLHRIKESEHDRWIRQHPWGEAGSIDYWIEVMHRAYELGEVRAQAVAEQLLALQGPQPPRDYLSFPSWFWTLWTDHLRPSDWDRKEHPHRMPY